MKDVLVALFKTLGSLTTACKILYDTEANKQVNNLEYIFKKKGVHIIKMVIKEEIKVQDAKERQRRIKEAEEILRKASTKEEIANGKLLLEQAKNYVSEE